MNFIDYHAHVYGTGYKVLYPKLDNCSSIADVQKVVRDASQKTTRAILLRGWDQNKWGATGFPTKDDIDSVESEIPVALIRIDGRAMWCNWVVLRFVGFDTATISLTCGVVVDDERC